MLFVVGSAIYKPTPAISPVNLDVLPAPRSFGMGTQSPAYPVLHSYRAYVLGTLSRYLGPTPAVLRFVIWNGNLRSGTARTRKSLTSTIFAFPNS